MKMESDDGWSSDSLSDGGWLSRSLSACSLGTSPCGLNAKSSQQRGFRVAIHLTWWLSRYVSECPKINWERLHGFSLPNLRDTQLQSCHVHLVKQSQRGGK